MLNCRASFTLQVQGVVGIGEGGIEGCSVLIIIVPSFFSLTLFLSSSLPLFPPSLTLSPPLRALIIRTEGGRAAAKVERGASLDHLPPGKAELLQLHLPVLVRYCHFSLPLCRLQWTLRSFMTLQVACRRKESLQ